MAEDSELIKIVFLVNCPPFDGNTPFNQPLGGTESAIVYIARELAKTGNQVIVFNDCKKKKKIENVTYDKQNNFLDFINNNETDILVFVRGFPNFLNLKAKIVIFWTGDDYDQKLNKSFAEHSFCGELTDKIFVLSNYQKKNFHEKLKIPNKKFFLTRNGINSEFYQITKPRKKFKLVYTSAPYRGLNLLIDIFPEIKKKIPEAELYIFSSMITYGFDKEYDQAEYGNIYQKLKLIPGIKLLSPLSQPALSEELKEAYLMVYPNNFPETSCIAALEAQAAGVPVISSDIGALPETIADTETGFLIKGIPDSMQYKTNFINAVLELINNENLWQIMSKNAELSIKNKFLWKIIADEWINEFNNLLSEHQLTKEFLLKIKETLLSLVEFDDKYACEIYNKLIKVTNFISLLTIRKEILELIIKNENISDFLKLNICLKLGEIEFISNRENAAIKYFILATNIYLSEEFNLNEIYSIEFAIFETINYYQYNNTELALKICQQALKYMRESCLLKIKLCDFLILKKRFKEALIMLDKANILLVKRNITNLVNKDFFFEIINYRITYCQQKSKEK